MSAQLPIELTVTNEAGLSETITVRGIRVPNFEEAGKALESKSEFRLVELACNKPPGWAMALSVESYNELVAAVTARCHGFFSWYGRRAGYAMLGNPAEALRVAGTR